MKYPEHIMQSLRMRYDIPKDDDCMDKVFESMPKTQVLDEVLGWEGICGYTQFFIELVNDIFGVDLEEVE